MPAYTHRAVGSSRKIQPMSVTPVCLERIAFLRESFDRGADAAPVRTACALEIPIEPDSRRLADQIVLGHEAPDTPVLAVVAIVAHHQVHAGGYVLDDRWQLREAVLSRVLIRAPAEIPTRFAPVATRRWRGPDVQRHRAHHRLVHMLAEVLHGQLHIQIAAVVVGLYHVKWHGLTEIGRA